MIFNKFKSKNGSSTIYELLISLTLLTFVMMFPIGVFSYIRTETNINDVVNLAMQSIEKNGQLTPALIDTINDNLKEKNLPSFDEGDGKASSLLITNMEVTTEAPNIAIMTNQQATAIGSSKTYDKFVIVIPDENGKDGSSTTYLKKYRNAFITKASWNNNKTVYYDIKCNNTNCSRYGQIQYISNLNEYKCPSCGNVSKLENCNEANVIYLTIAVPVTQKVEFLNRIMKLISFGIGDSEIFGNSNSFIENNGDYYFIKTLYGTAEKYYYVGSGVK